MNEVSNLDCRLCERFVWCDFGKQYTMTIMGKCDDYKEAKKMTDEQIIKALECCIDTSPLTCKSCPLFNATNSRMVCSKIATNLAFDLINRQKAEIDRLEKMLDSSVSGERNAVDNIPYERAEAITAYHEEVKKRCVEGGIYPAFVKRQMEDVKREMVGDKE